MKLTLFQLSILVAVAFVNAASPPKDLDDEHSYGWIRQPIDLRDYPYVPSTLSLPPKHDLRPRFANISIYDQLKLSSCTANAVAFSHYYAQIDHTMPNVAHISRLALYYNARVLDGTAQQDAGSSFRSALKVANQYGVCRETLWPYLSERVLQRPNAACEANAANYKARVYFAVSQSVEAIKKAITDGNPVMFGFQVYSSFLEAEKTGIMPIPSYFDRHLGGHAINAIGFDDSLHGGVFIIRNSYGPTWGLGGNFYMPYAIINMNIASDFWVLT